MELGKQIRKLRNEKLLSQEQLAQLLYVSRQTISNWENDKSYPDIHSLLLLSQVLDVAIDQLVKGDLEMMKKQINEEDISKFNHLSNLFGVMLLITMITPIPLIYYFDSLGIIIWVVIFIVAFYVACISEKEKKRLNIQTYKEIITFINGKQLDQIDKIREEGKRPYQKFVYTVVIAIITLVINVLMIIFFK